MKLLIIFFLLVSFAYAGQVEIGKDAQYNPIIITYDDKYSLRDFTNQNLQKLTDLNGKTIYASCFSQETPNIHIFPDDMHGVTFYNCNLMNVFIPAGNTVIGGTQKRFKVQNDLRDWFIDAENKPVEVVSKEIWENQGYSVDPKDIPVVKLTDINQIKKAQ